MPIDETLGSAQNGGALGCCDLSTAKGISEVVEVQDVVALSTGRYQQVNVEITHDKPSLGEFNLDQVDVPPTLYRAVEHNGPGQLDALVKQ